MDFNGGLERQQLRNTIGVGFLSNLHSNYLQMTRCYPHSKEGQYTYSNQLTNLETIFYGFLGSFAIWGSGATIVHLPHGLRPTNTCPTKNSNCRCLECVMFECHANFQINWESFAHRDQQKGTCLRYVASKMQRWQMSSRHLWSTSTVNKLSAHSHIPTFWNQYYSCGMTQETWTWTRVVETISRNHLNYTK